jgi:TRAP-type C4-dicarboxylate transport system substrate-binding protein
MLLRAAFAVLLLVAPASAQQTVLTLKHFLPADSPAQTRFLAPWAEEVAQASGGRLRVAIVPGQPPAQLAGELASGAADLVWTVPSYTPGRFPRTEVFELPFVAGKAAATAQAVHEAGETLLRAEFAGLHLLALHAHAPGSLFLRTHPLRRIEDLKGLKLRAPTRSTGAALTALGAESVLLPLSQVTAALSDGRIDGALLPFEVALPLAVPRHVRHVAELPGFYTTVFLFAMNRARHDALPPDLRRVIAEASGRPLARRLGLLWDEIEAPGAAAAIAAGAKIEVLPEDETARMRAATQPAVDAWLARIGAEGPGLLAAAKALVRKYEAAP